MAFGNITTLYFPTAANAGASLWGSDVRKVLDSADAASDATSKTNHGTGGAVVRTVDPYTTSTTDGTEANFGWAVAPSDMNSVSGARRFYPPGNHVLTVRMGHNGSTGVTGTLTMYVYRVGPAAGRTRTLLGSNSASVALPALSGEVTASVTVALPEVIFDVDETVQYSYEFNCAGIIVTGRIATFFTGTQTAVAARVVTPKLGVLADTTGTSTGSAAVDGVSGKVLATVGTVTSTGAATGVMGSTAGTTGAAEGSAAADGQGSSVASTTGTAAGSGAAIGVLGATGGTIGTASGSSTVTGVLGATGGTIGTAVGAGTASGLLGATGGMVGTAAGSGSALAQASSVAGTTGIAGGSATAVGLASIVLGTVGTVEIGADSAEHELPSSADGVNGPVTIANAGALSIMTSGPATASPVAQTVTLTTTGPLTATIGDGDPTIEVCC